MAEDEPFVRQWMRTVRRIRLGRTVKAVATMLATYANQDGSRVFPGVARLSHECELSYTSVKGALRTLRHLGLIEKVGRRGDADEYRLFFHEDLLERVDVPTPAQADVEIGKIRAAWKGTYAPSLRSTRTPAENGDREGLRSTAPTAESPVGEESAVNRATPETGSAVNGSNSLRSTAPTANYQEEPPTKKDHSDQALVTDVKVSRASEAETEDPDFSVVQLDQHPRCPHGRSTRLNRHGEPRCEDCRAEAEAQTIAAAAARVELGPTKCTPHKRPISNCHFCRRGLPGAEA